MTFDDETINQMYDAYLTGLAAKTVDDLINDIVSSLVRIVIAGEIANQSQGKKRKSITVPCSAFYFPDCKHTVYYEKHRNYRIYQPKRKIPIISEEYDV